MTRLCKAFFPMTILLMYVFVGFGTSSQTRAQSAKGDDYMSPELRAQVEQLKRDVASEPTSRNALVERARVFWKWSNAHALNGGYLMVNAPQTVAQIMAYTSGRAVIRRHSLFLDQSVRELQVWDEQPGAIGKLSTNITGPFIAGSYTTITQTYTVGDMAMSPNCGVLLAAKSNANHGRYQTTDPTAENYVTIQASNESAKFVRHNAAIRGMHGAAGSLVFRLKEGNLGSGETFTITYGDRSGGSKGFLIQTFSNDRFPLPLYIDLEGKENFFSLPMQHYKVIGTEVHGVHGFAPSVVQVNEPFELSVRSEDIYTNRASGTIPGYEVSVGGEGVARIDASDQAITVLSLSFSQPGVYRYEIQSADSAIQGVSNPIWVQENPDIGIYWGDTHGHSGFAEGQGTPDAYFEFGRDDARLDFLTHSEHDLWMDDAEWQTLKENVEKYSEEGKFITFLGYEWTLRLPNGGHHNVLFRTPEGRDRVPVQEVFVLSELYSELRHANDMDDVLIIPHAHQSGDYRLNHPRMETLVEIMSKHGTFQWFGQRYLDHGHRVGFIAASDDHLSHPGYGAQTTQPGGLAAVMAGEKTTDAIFDAMKNRSTYATSGPRMILDYTLNGAAMGSQIDMADERKIVGQYFGTAPLDKIVLIKNGEPLWIYDAQDVQNSDFQHVQLQFGSETDPIIRDNPRGWRMWQGTIEVKNARLIDASSVSLQNPYREYIRTDQLNRVEFATMTRGNLSYVDLELEDAGPQTTISLTLKPVREFGTVMRFRQRNQRIPAKEIVFSFQEIKQGRLTHSILREDFSSHVTLQCVNPNRPIDHSFEYIDNENPRRGDYYYVRVDQIDGNQAWSSPIWVGGEPPR